MSENIFTLLLILVFISSLGGFIWSAIMYEEKSFHKLSVFGWIFYVCIFSLGIGVFGVALVVDKILNSKIPNILIKKEYR